MARLAYLSEDDLDASDHDVLQGPVALTRLLAHSPDLSRRFLSLGRYFRVDTVLDPRLRELAILQVGFITKCDYEYSHHVKIGKEIGVSDDDFDAIRAESRGEVSDLPELDRAILAAAREMTLDLKITDSTWAKLKAHLDDRSLLDLVVAIATYNSVVRVLESLEIDVEPDYLPLLEGAF